MSQFANQNSVERNRGSDFLPQDPGLLNQAVGFLNEGKPFLLFGAFRRTVHQEFITGNGVKPYLQTDPHLRLRTAARCPTRRVTHRGPSHRRLPSSLSDSTQRLAQQTSWAADYNASFTLMRRRWVSIVLTLRPSRLAISLVPTPWPMSSKTSNSRSVRRVTGASAFGTVWRRKVPRNSVEVRSLKK